MRNFKKVLAAAAAIAMLAGLTVTAAADAPSVAATQGAKVTSEDGGYIVEAPGEHFEEEMAKVDQTVVDAIAAANEVGASEAGVKAFVDELKKSDTKGKDEVIAALDGKKFFTTFFDVYPYGNASATNADVKMTVAGIGSYSKNDITLVHYNVASGKWEVLDFELLGGDKISVHFDSFSPTSIAVIAKTKTTDNTSSKTTTSTSSSTSSSTTSPKTGVESTWMIYAAAALMLAVCGAFISRKERA